jgi:hypothetical protein
MFELFRVGNFADHKLFAAFDADALLQASFACV